MCGRSVVKQKQRGRLILSDASGKLATTAYSDPRDESLLCINCTSVSSKGAESSRRRTIPRSVGDGSTAVHLESAQSRMRRVRPVLAREAHAFAGRLDGRLNSMTFGESPEKPTPSTRAFPPGGKKTRWSGRSVSGPTSGRPRGRPSRHRSPASPGPLPGNQSDVQIVRRVHAGLWGAIRGGHAVSPASPEQVSGSIAAKKSLTSGPPARLYRRAAPRTRFPVSRGQPQRYSGLSHGISSGTHHPPADCKHDRAA